MFLGQYSHSFDEKGRLTIPVKYREALHAGAYVTQGFDRNLMVWTAASFEQIYAQVNDLSITDPNARLLKRLIFSNAVQVEIDRVGLDPDTVISTGSGQLGWQRNRGWRRRLF